MYLEGINDLRVGRELEEQLTRVQTVRLSLYATRGVGVCVETRVRTRVGFGTLLVVLRGDGVVESPPSKEGEFFSYPHYSHRVTDSEGSGVLPEP